MRAYTAKKLVTAKLGKKRYELDLSEREYDGTPIEQDVISDEIKQVPHVCDFEGDGELLFPATPECLALLDKEGLEYEPLDPKHCPLNYGDGNGGTVRILYDAAEEEFVILDKRNVLVGDENCSELD